jgi:rSAM/selenodomain-associated transferase 1
MQSARDARHAESSCAGNERLPRRLLGVLAKWPRPGMVKTRLAAAVGAERAAQLAEAFLRDVVDRFAIVADERWLGFAPDNDAARTWFQALSAERYTLWPQPAGGLGERIEAFFAAAASLGTVSAVLIGSDSPTLPTEFVEQAFGLLEEHPTVLGPAEDGGYYLIGARTPLTGVLRAVRWSSEHALRDTQAALHRAHLPPALLPTWYDLDAAVDLQRVVSDCQAARRRGQLCPAPRTEALLMHG